MFLLRELKEKKKFFLLHELVNGPTAGNQKKKILFTARTNVFLLRELDHKKKKNFFLLHELVPSLIDRKQEKKKVFLLHELVQKFVRNNYHIYVRKKN